MRRGIYSFSQSNLQRFVANHLDKFILGCIFFIFTFTILKIGYLSTYAIIILVFLCIIPYIFGKIQQKFAYKVIVDFESRRLRLHMHRSAAVVTANFDDIQNIRVNGYIIFVLKERKVFYNDLQNRDLFNCLTKIMQIQWGPLCAVWGPSKNVRDALKRK